MDTQQKQSPAPQGLTLKYPECKKGQCHVGEVLNLVCIEPKCIDKSVICGICYDEEHKGHKIRPLKIVINNSKKYLEQLTPMNIDPKTVKESLLSSKKNILEKYEDFAKYMGKTIESIKDNINAVFIKISEQVELKCGSNEQLISALNEIKHQEIENERFVALMKKLLVGVPLEAEEQQNEMNSKDIEESIKSMTKKIQSDLQKKSTLVKKQLQSFTSSLKKTFDSSSVFDLKVGYKFSHQLKHTGTEVVSDQVIKSTQAYNYHFALMEPSLHEKGNRPITVAFKICQNTSNWLAVGICHRNIVQANNYQFNYSALGHGGYLISCNGGSWSSIDNSKNNVVISFNFIKNDIILLSYEPDDNRVVFTKKGTEETHTLEFENKDDDELYLCGLFYYSNDEIEYLGLAEDLEDDKQ